MLRVSEALQMTRDCMNVYFVVSCEVMIPQNSIRAGAAFRAQLYGVARAILRVGARVLMAYWNTPLVRIPTAMHEKVDSRDSWGPI